MLVNIHLSSPIFLITLMEDAEFDNIKKIFDLKAGPADYDTRMKTGLNSEVSLIITNIDSH